MKKKKIITGTLCGALLLCNVCGANALETLPSKSSMEENEISISEDVKISSNPEQNDSNNIDENNIDIVSGIPNPYVKYDTLKKAQAKVGFKITLPNLKKYNKKEIYVIANKALQVNYSNGKNTICIRKAKGSNDISGDYNKYKKTKTIKVNGINVLSRSNKKNKTNVATWKNGKYTFSITTNSLNGMKNINLINMIKDTK